MQKACVSFSFSLQMTKEAGKIITCSLQPSIDPVLWLKNFSPQNDLPTPGITGTWYRSEQQRSSDAQLEALKFENAVLRRRLQHLEATSKNDSRFFLFTQFGLRISILLFFVLDYIYNWFTLCSNFCVCVVVCRSLMIVASNRCSIYVFLFWEPGGLVVLVVYVAFQLIVFVVPFFCQKAETWSIRC